jgi:predicted transcriptional regulator
MSNREIVMNLLSKLPEDASLGEIAREIELLAGIQRGREQARRGEGIPAEEARKLVDAWAAQ